MLVRGDLGFPSPAFLVVVVVVVVTVILFVVRRKWRYAVARREEVKRLLVLASEESVRAEFEAREGYYYTATTTPSSTASVSASVPLDSPLKVQHECAVCCCPTTTRCAKCKAVRYCSGKCQIIHWRQGHKDDCRPYIAASPINDMGGSPYRQADGKDYSNRFDMEGQQTAPPAERYQENLHQKGEVRVKSPRHHQGTNSTSESAFAFSYKGYSGFSTPTKLPAGVAYENLDTVRPEDQTMVSPARKSTGLGTINQNISNFSDEDTLFGTSRSPSSCRTDDGSNASLLSEPSTTSSGFWGGAIYNKKSTINERDDFAPSSFTEVTNGHMTDHITTKNGFSAASVITDGSGLTRSGSKKSNDATNMSKETLNDGLKSRRLPFTSEMLKSKVRESKSSPSAAAPHHASAVGGHSTLKPFGGLAYSCPERSNHVFNNKNVTSMEVGSSLSRASDSHLTSFTTRHASHVTKPLKPYEYNHRATTCSSQLTENFRSVRTGSKSLKVRVVDQVKPSNLPLSKGFFSYKMFVKLYNSNKIELQPCGFRNCGNSCYANAVLQCLVYTPPLTAYFLEGLHSKACDKRGWCFMCEFEGLVLKAKNGNSPLSPIRLLTHIENVGGNLGHGKEEDAHEFLRYVIDALQSVCIKEAGASAFNSLEEETTLIGLTFGGYLRSKIKCMKCGGKSELHERMMDLTVEIEGNIGTLEEALDKFTCNEILDGENKYKCSRCKSYEKAKKNLTLLEAPNVLTIALKRFQSGKFGKLNKSIIFPEILDMAPYVSGTSDKSPVYRLYGVVVHVDTMNDAFSGHYVCYVKNVQNRWFKIDDTMVKEVDVRRVLTKGAYMLLYARCSPRAPRSIRGSLNHHDPQKHKTPTSLPPGSLSTEPWDATNYHRNPPPPLHHHHHRTLEDESSSSSDNSGFFSESCSCSTDSSRQDSSGIEDHISGDWDSGGWRNTTVNSSDSDTSSTSSFPSPLYSRLSDLYTSSKKCRKLDCSCNVCKVNNFDRLGGHATNPTSKRGQPA